MTRNTMKTMNITKASGELRPFSEDKLRKSLFRSGAGTDQVDIILDSIRSQLYEGMPTKKIYKIAFAMLREGSRHFAARYHLKKAIMELGPSGFPFEKYIAGILTVQGYKTKTGQTVPGQCVNHEIDVIARKNDELLLIECKYHNSSGIICNVRIPLYIYARFLDVRQRWGKLPGQAEKKQRCRVVTNTRFSVDAIQYASCAGLELLGWDYPFAGSLKEQIDTLGLYPLTCVTSLTAGEKQQLLGRKIVLCNELLNNEKLLVAIGVKEGRRNIIMQELRQLCGMQNKDAKNAAARNHSNYSS